MTKVEFADLYLCALEINLMKRGRLVELTVERELN